MSIYSIYTVWIITVWRKKNPFVFGFDSWSEHKSRFELTAAHLKLVESVNTLGHTDRWQTWKVIPSGNFLAGSVRPTNSHHEYGWIYTKSLLYNYTVTTTKWHQLYFTHIHTRTHTNTSQSANKYTNCGLEFHDPKTIHTSYYKQNLVLYILWWYITCGNIYFLDFLCYPLFTNTSMEHNFRMHSVLVLC